MATPFELLGVPTHFSLDEAELERRHRELSRALHPDRYVGRPSSERREALNRAISLNEAFRTLRDPISRAEALLVQLGGQPQGGEQPKPDPLLLLQVMEEREGLMLARRAGDHARVEGIREGAASRAELAAERIADAFSEQPVPVERVLTALAELRYLRRLQEEAGAALDEL